MRFDVILHINGKRVIRYAHELNDLNDKIYTTLTSNGISEEIAIDCASWCELAEPGESYNEEDFDVYVYEMEE